MKLLKDRDCLVSANAAKSLGRIGNKEHYDSIYKRFYEGVRGNLERDLNYLIAFHNMAPVGEWLETLFDEKTLSMGETYVQNYITLISQRLGMNPPLGWIYQRNNDEPGEGMVILLDEAREIELFYENQEWLYRVFSEKKYQLVWEWCRSVLFKTQAKGAAKPILKSIRALNMEKADSSNTLAVLFYTYHILKNGGEF